MPKDKLIINGKTLEHILKNLSDKIISQHSSHATGGSARFADLSGQPRRTARRAEGTGKHEKTASDKSDKNQMVLIGIHRRGVPLGTRLKNLIEKKINKKLLFGTLDITLYRDDLDTIGYVPVVKNTDIPFDLTDKNIILVDDVLFTGRTVRAALNELADFGRPKRIQLSVLIDRGHRELPISADYIGKAIKTERNEIVMVRLKETDGVDEVLIRQER